MNFEHILEHHLLDHSYFKMFSLGGVNFMFTKHLAVLWSVSLLVIAVLSLAARGRARAGLVLRSGVEAVVLYMRDHMLRPIFHEATHTYLPYFLTLFFFIFTCNIVGLIPEAAAVTSNISVTLALALCTFMLIHFAGVKEQGAISYVAHITPSGLPFWLVPLVFVIEVAGLLAKTVSLCIRLFANILAGHIVSLAFLCMIFIFGQLSPLIGLGVAPAAVGLALFVYTLDVLVALLQAYIFTFLTALFVGGAVHPH
jgi:F-type H+-transporting ATPase subunit a